MSQWGGLVLVPRAGGVDAEGEEGGGGLLGAGDVFVRPAIDGCLQGPGGAAEQRPCLGLVGAKPQDAAGIGEEGIHVIQARLEIRSTHADTVLEEECGAGNGEAVEELATPLEFRLEGFLALFLASFFAGADGLEGDGRWRRDGLDGVIGGVFV